MISYKVLIEDAIFDKEKRQFALKIHKRLTNLFKSKSQIKKYLILNRKGGYYYIFLKKVSGFSYINDVLVVIQKAEGIGGQAGGMSRIKKAYEGVDFIFTLNILPPEWNSDMLIPELSKLIKIKEDLIIHEITHYIDMKRFKGVYGQLRSTTPSTDSVEYYNDPLEFNAYYQETYNTIEDNLRNLNYLEKQNVLTNMKKDNTVLLSIMKTVAGPAYDNLSSKYKRKFIKRFQSSLDYLTTSIENGTL